MQALVNAFIRCLYFLLPPSWLHLGVCWWVGDECGKTTWPNPRARFKSRTLLTYQEVTTQDGSIPSVSPAPSCVSLAASSTPPQGSPWGRIWGLWQAVERIFGASVAIQKRRGVCAPYSCDFNCCITGNKGFHESTTTGVAEEEVNEPGENAFISGKMTSATMEFQKYIESASASSAGRETDEVIIVDQHLHEMGTQVMITVAIQAADDEEPEEEVSSNNLDFLGGSCSEDEFGRHDKSR